MAEHRFAGAFVAAVFAFSGAAASCSDEGERRVAQSQPVGTISYAALKAEVISRSIGSVDEMLEAFAQSDRFRPLLENPVLNEKSFALHGLGVGPDFPRIVLHQGNLIMHTLGDPASPEGHSVEIMEFVPDDRRFHYRLVNFAAKDTPNWFVDEAEHADFKSMGPAFEGFFECSMCHALEATESRPRWPTGPLWQTPFGKVGNRIAAGTGELADWARFQATLTDPAKSRRYRALGLGRTETDAAGNVSFLDRPNFALTQAIARLNRQRIGRIVTTWPGFAAQEVAVVGAFLGCSDFEGFLPEAERAGRRSALIAALSARPNSIFPTVSRSHVDPAKLAALLAADTFGSRSVRGRPDMVGLLDQEFLAISSLPTVAALEELVRGAGETTLAAMLDRDDTHFDLRGFVHEGVDYGSMPFPELVAKLTTEDDRYYPAIARLRYLMEDTVTEHPLNWSTAVPFSFGFTYRFGDGEGGLWRVLADEIGPRFLADHPELDRFSGHVVSPDRLTMGVEAYCDLLRDRSH